MDLKALIREIPDFPTPGIHYYDLTTLFESPHGFAYVLDQLAEVISALKAEKLVAIEARGFIVGAALAGKLRLPFVPIRKKGKLPGETVSQSYGLEYGQDTIEIHKDAIKPDDKVVLVDDLIATGGTLRAACDLIEKLQGKIAGIVSIAALTHLPFNEKLAEYDIHYLVGYSD